METLKDTCRIAVVQAAPVMFDKDKCVDKALELLRECAANGAELVVCPELFIPGYPYGMTFGFTVGSRKADGRKDWKQYYDNSITAAGAEMQRLIDAAKELGVYVSIGYSERDTVTATLYNSNLMIAPDGTAVCGSLFLAGEALQLLNTAPCGSVRFTPNETFAGAIGG